MAKKLILILTAMVFVASMFVIATAEEGAKEEKKAEEKAVKHEYVGADKCKTCHKKDETHPSWLKTKHATAFEALTEEQKKDKSCVGCHTTGTTAAGELLVGVQCEACHGPGSDYKSMKIMKDEKLAMENGLLIPDAKTCAKCHNENVPEEFRSKEKFDFEKMKAKGVHAMPVEEETTEAEG